MNCTQSFHGAYISSRSSFLLSLPRHVIFLVQSITAQIFLGENSVVKVCYVVRLFIRSVTHVTWDTSITDYNLYRVSREECARLQENVP